MNTILEVLFTLTICWKCRRSQHACPADRIRQCLSYKVALWNEQNGNRLLSFTRSPWYSVDLAAFYIQCNSNRSHRERVAFNCRGMRCPVHT